MHFFWKGKETKQNKKMVSNNTPLCGYQSTIENKSTIVFICPLIQIYVIVMMVENTDNVCILPLQSVI